MNYDNWKLRAPHENEDEVIVHTCESCGKDIVEGEDYYDFNDTITCEAQECIVDALGGIRKTAEAE